MSASEWCWRLVGVQHIFSEFLTSRVSAEPCDLCVLREVEIILTTMGESILLYSLSLSLRTDTHTQYP